jgi:BirA family biotin operon repressor/biotin-[acetyl-CoA-carboxylase] ligase
MSERLDAAWIVSRLTPTAERWLDDIAIHESIGSTNKELVDLAARRSIDGVVCLAETQTAGRGRRGRAWMSPPGPSISLPLGRVLALPPTQVGALSLVVGLAVADALSAAGVRLKWPNDLLLSGRKLGGILVELVEGKSSSTVVVGVGINVDVPSQTRERIDQPIANLTDAIDNPSRNDIVAMLINAIVDFSSQFETVGFSAMKEAWQDLHQFHGQPVRLLIADRVVDGLVVGVEDSGELVLDCGDELRRFSAGEVSLRPVGGP